jgi:hypothetical protein
MMISCRQVDGPAGCLERMALAQSLCQQLLHSSAAAGELYTTAMCQLETWFAFRRANWQLWCPCNETTRIQIRSIACCSLVHAITVSCIRCVYNMRYLTLLSGCKQCRKMQAESLQPRQRLKWLAVLTCAVCVSFAAAQLLTASSENHPTATASAAARSLLVQKATS